MIDTNQLSALISAFRVETEKESISPETVGKLLQDILDLLANASTDTERKVFDDWKHRASRTQMSLLNLLRRGQDYPKWQHEELRIMHCELCIKEAPNLLF